MKHIGRRVAIYFVFLCLFALCTPTTVWGQEAETQAINICSRNVITASNGFDQTHRLYDGNETYGISAYLYEGETAWIQLDYSEGMGSLYLILHTRNPYTITDNATGVSVTAGENGYYHQFVDLVTRFGYAPTSLTLDFGTNPITINELYAFTEGEVPSFVQRWNPPVEGKTDLLLFSAHGDDEQLFFTGVLPYYAKELGYQVQVVYMTSHQNTEPYRVHEMLNGLWSVGVETYPVFAEFYDFSEYVFNGKYELDYVYGWYSRIGQPREMILEFAVEQIRRFKPQVIVTHDFAGEYGHPQHIICADVVAQALEDSNKQSLFPQSAEAYGIWDTPKAYFHLYEENQIVMDWDQPLESFDGMTAFQVSQKLGFPCHASQVAYFSWYHLNRASAAACPYYSPCYYGLYRSTVGPDVAKNDFFENLISYAQQEKLAEEARIEEERLAAERAEQERLAAEESARKEEAERAEALRREEEAARLAEQARQQKQKTVLITAGAILFAVAAGSILLIWVIKKRRG